MYELLTGELPIGRFAAPSAKSSVDARIDAIVLRALAKERELRQQTAREVKTEVEGVGGKPTPPAVIASPETPFPSRPAPAPTPRTNAVKGAPHSRYWLCPPSLPGMAQAIILYGLLFRPLGSAAFFLDWTDQSEVGPLRSPSSG